MLPLCITVYRIVREVACQFLLLPLVRLVRSDNAQSYRWPTVSICARLAGDTKFPSVLFLLREYSEYSLGHLFTVKVQFSHKALAAGAGRPNPATCEQKQRRVSRSLHSRSSIP